MEHLRDDHERRGASLVSAPAAFQAFHFAVSSSAISMRRADLTVKAVLGLDHADMVRIAELFCGLLEREHDVEAGGRRKLDGQIFTACALLTIARSR